MKAVNFMKAFVMKANKSLQLQRGASAVLVFLATSSAAWASPNQVRINSMSELTKHSRARSAEAASYLVHPDTGAEVNQLSSDENLVRQVGLFTKDKTLVGMHYDVDSDQPYYEFVPTKNLLKSKRVGVGSGSVHSRSIHSKFKLLYERAMQEQDAKR